MTHFFQYDNLTWPDIAQLPRHTPLLLPLGSGYPLEALVEALGNPSQIGMLPPFPFGWTGSGLRVPEKLLGTVISNLLNSLSDDGFSRVYALTPQGMNLELGVSRIALPHPDQWASQPPLPLDSDRHKVVIIPIGHTEQHGYHLPLSTDSLIIEAIAQGTTAQIPNEAVTLPVMPYGVSTHRWSFAGTLNTGGRAFEDFWLGVLDILVARGFERFYFISGHGGNCSFLVNVVKYAGERYRHIFCATAWLHTSGTVGAEALQKYRRSALGGMGHAGELETSMILCLRPDLVQSEKAVDETEFISTPSYYMDWIEGGALIANPPWEDDTATGAYGAGSLATAENGQIWLQAAIQEKVGHVAEIHEQQHRRQAKRHQLSAKKHQLLSTE